MVEYYPNFEIKNFKKIPHNPLIASNPSSSAASKYEKLTAKVNNLMEARAAAAAAAGRRRRQECERDLKLYTSVKAL
jgi:hypothetical protein